MIKPSTWFAVSINLKSFTQYTVCDKVTLVFLSPFLTDKPKIVSTIQDTSLTEGQTLQLNCEADSNPSPIYQWRHNNKTLENENKATLLIESIQQAKAGIYECILSNLAGETSVKMRVDISGDGKWASHFEHFESF